ncbi:hypothetical protein CDL15_Pgr026554 [Punica granatum]|uniref:PRP1 splicing factor N-terminal domain-containing protein n=1 Tax=Punica granatum TaxID=22663 RepID=A0A218WKY6_PUNGR|nr:hypothetical protein CDL15_Pgr026554 [Punica granatum]
MPPRRRDRIDDVLERDNLRHLEQRMEQIVNQRMDPGGDGELEFNEDDEEDDKGYDENRKFDEFEGNDVGLFASAEYDEDDKEADAV